MAVGLNDLVLHRTSTVLISRDSGKLCKQNQGLQAMPAKSLVGYSSYEVRMVVTNVNRVEQGLQVETNRLNCLLHRSTMQE